mgnify:FL=1
MYYIYIYIYMSSSSSKSNDNTFREAIDWAIDSMTTIDTPPILSDPQKQKLINAIGKKTDPGGSTHNIKQYLSNLPLNEDLRNNIEMLLDFLPMVIYLPFGCLHDFGDKKVAKICLVAGMTHFFTTRPTGTNFALLINILRQELTTRDLATLGLEISGDNVAVKDATGNGEDTFATKDTKALHNVWWKLLELVIAKIKYILPEGVQWNFVPMKKPFSFTGDKTDDARQTLADEIKAWVNGFAKGVNIAEKIVAVLDVTDKIALLVSGNKVLQTDPLSVPTMGDIDAFSPNVPDATSFTIPAELFQETMLRGSVGLFSIGLPSVKIYFQIITKDHAAAMVPAARSIRGQTTIVYEGQQILQYTKNDQGADIHLALIPFSISVNNVYLSCKKFGHPVANRGIGFTVEACKVIWLQTLSSIDKAVLLEACKGKGDETTSDLCEKKIELQEISPPEEGRYFFWSVGGDELQLDYQVSLGLPGFIRSGDGYSRTVVVWASTLGGDIAPIMIQLFLNKLEDLVKCATIWLQPAGNDNITNMLSDFEKDRGNIIDELQNLINLNAFLNFLVTINVSADNCHKLVDAALTFVTSTQETEKASDTFINIIQSLANGIEFGYSELLDELDAGIRPDNEEGNYVAYTVESSCSPSASTLREVHKIKITKQSPGEELPEIISIANIMHRCSKSLHHLSPETELIDDQHSVVNAVDEWLTQNDDGKLATQVAAIMGSPEAGNCFLGEIKAIHPNILRRILKNTRKGIEAAKPHLNPTASSKSSAGKAKSAAKLEEERRIEKGELLWPYLAVNEVRVVVPTMEQMKGEIEENLQILQHYGVKHEATKVIPHAVHLIMQIIQTQQQQRQLRPLKTRLFYNMKELEKIKRENKGHLDQLRSTDKKSNLLEQIGRNNIQEAIKIVLKNCELVRGLSLRRRDDERRGVGGIEMVDYTDGNRFCIGDDVLQSIAKTETLPELCRETKFNVIWEALESYQTDTATAAGKSFMRILYYFLKDNLEGYIDGADMNKLIYSIFYHCMGVDNEQKKAVFGRVKWKVALESIIALDGTGAQSQESRGRRRVRDAGKSETSGTSSGTSGSESRRRRSASRSRSPSPGGIDDPERRKIKERTSLLVSAGRELKEKFETAHHETTLKLQQLRPILENRSAGGGKKMKTIKKQKRKKKTRKKKKRKRKKTRRKRRKKDKRKTRRKR